MGRPHMPTGNSQGRSSRMASGKRASMREGPLAALFRKTEEEGLEERPAPPREDPAAEAHPQPQQLPPRREPPAPQPPQERPAPRAPVQRLRDVFSSDIPDNMMERGAVRPAGEDL